MRINAIEKSCERGELYCMNLEHLLASRSSFWLLCGLTLYGFVGSARAESPGEDAEAKKKPTVKLALIDRAKMKAPSAFTPDSYTLRDTEGREIEAFLLSANGETIKIKRVDDEREFDVPMAMFDSSSNNQIRGWMDDVPGAVSYSVGISAQRHLASSNEFSISGKMIKTGKWSYRVTVTNQTRNDLRDAQVEYRIIYDDNVEFVRTAVGPGKGENQQDGQAVDLPDMVFNDEVEFDTPVLDLHTYEFIPTAKGAEREFIKDDIKGVWIRVTRKGELIGEYKSNEASMGSLSWDNEEDVEITVRNKFRDSFGDSTNSGE
jgi:hypothetical protein